MSNKGFIGKERFEETFIHQVDDNGRIKQIEYLFTKKFGDSDDLLPIEKDRYRIVWMPGCPYANKTVITWKLLGLDNVISLAQASIIRSKRGWVFGPELLDDEIDPNLGKYQSVDPVLGVHYLHDIYLRSHPSYEGRSTVPTIVDVKTGFAANNDHMNIPTYFARDWKRFHKKGAPELYPIELRDEIDKLNDWIWKRINKGAYAAGFAKSQEEYDEGYEKFFEALDILEERLSKSRFLFGDHITLSDIHLYVTLIRFYQTYYNIFLVNKKRLDEYDALFGYARDLYSIPEFKEYTKLDLIKKHYQLSTHLRAKFGNEYGIYAIGPDESKWELPNDRDLLAKDKNIFIREVE